MTNTLSSLAMSTCGYLELIAGPMYAGKTSKLLELHKQFTFCAIPTLVINFAEDVRYSDTCLSTHDQLMIPCERAHCLEDISPIYQTPSERFDTARVILINEGQFFPDIVAWVRWAVDVHHKIIYVCGLDGDFRRQNFGDWLNLIPFCDSVVKLHSLCSMCKIKNAIFSHRLCNDQTQKLIGTANYLPLCRGCFTLANSKKPLIN